MSRQFLKWQIQIGAQRFELGLSLDKLKSTFQLDSRIANLLNSGPAASSGYGLCFLFQIKYDQRWVSAFGLGEWGKTYGSEGSGSGGLAELRGAILRCPPPPDEEKKKLAASSGVGFHFLC